MKPLLKMEGVDVRFGAVRAVAGARFVVREGSITGLIGPNGAGKSSLFAAIAGEYALSGGSITLQGERIDGLGPEEIFAKGLARTFQIPRPFPEMSVLENLMLAASGQAGERFWGPLLRWGRVRAEEAAIRERAAEILRFITLERLALTPARSLSGGQLKLLELGRVLMGDPAIILLDEPAAGVNPTLTELLIEKIVALNAQGKTFLIIEHDMDLVMRHCDPVVAMADGAVIFEGEAAAAQVDPRLLDAYLGAPADG